MSDVKQLLDDFKGLIQTSRDELSRQQKNHEDHRSDSIEKIEKINKDLNQIRAQYDEKLKDLETRNNSLETEIANLKRPVINGNPIDEAEQVRVNNFIKYIRKGDNSLSPDEVRALTNTSDIDGGFLIPPAFESGLITKAYEMEAIRPYANVGTTGRDRVIFPGLEQVNVGWSGVGPYSETTTNSNQVTIDIHKMVALITIPRDTLEDAEADIPNELNRLFSMSVSQEEDKAFAVGNSPKEPQGIFVNESVQANYVPTGVANDLSDTTHNGMDRIKDMVSQIKPYYLSGAAFMMNRFTENKVHQLKDNEGQYYWNPPTEVGKPATLLGYPVILPEAAPNIAANTYPIVFGNLMSGYAIRDRRVISIRRDESRYTEFDSVAFIVTKRVGGAVILPECFTILKVATS